MNCAICVLGLVSIGALASTVTAETEPVDTNAAQAWAAACVQGLITSGFDFLQTEKYDLWYNETSIMELAQSGTFIGPEEMTEYTNFVKAPFFDYYVSGDNWREKPIRLGQDECVMLLAGTNKMQVNAAMGNPVCVETTVGFKLHYTVADLDGSGFLIHRTNLFYSGIFIHELFANALNADGVRDYICDDVLMANCPEIVALNQLTSESCKERYDGLPDTNEGGYLDEFTTGCRILHSAFAETNAEHCPHLSFVPVADYKDRIKCQESYGITAEDLFSEDELAFIGDVAVNSGYDRLTKYKECEYERKGGKKDNKKTGKKYAKKEKAGKKTKKTNLF
mmetsp:Transcript_22652/g.34228  ORF Transcript_22652/g.34228 Transcript_22652/m.34228 type:complete len:337 (-) Transcript_22652:189-1199(-)